MHFESNLPFVLFKKPGASKLSAILQSDPELITTVGLDQPGFVMAPFDGTDAKPVFLRPDEYYQCDFNGTRQDKRPALPVRDDIAREIHLELVRKSISELNKGNLDKVVVARRFSIPYPGNVFSVYFELLKWYPDAFCYLWYHPDIGLWMGASPELLLRHSRGTAETIALAGTRPADPDEALPTWTEKERHEQQLVSDFIVGEILKLGMEPQSGQVRNIRAGNLWHLGTAIRVSVQPFQLPLLLGALHPTPAVCGLPREEATTFIGMNENFNREYYTGYLGEVGMEEPGYFEFFVNLRCVQFIDGKAYLYVGGGITSDSEPGAEWQETQEKSTTMLSVLKNS